ncbi:hypothetical protein [Nocardioides antri]|uniref:Uncharacterized protein n=1 Tax=Nocardioides antri TaxID=2607659 RepID=A0A5B1LSW8_9ACTN|nr:hypothetical protein [Nocardioides antri]KAA1423198.1 hypothetical protein F0U47_20190 [Nocardioides antri]
MSNGDYQALQAALRHFVRIAATPQYQQMVAVAREHARAQATASVRQEALRASEAARENIRDQAERAVEQRRLLSREAIEQARKAVEETRRLRVEAAKNAVAPNYLAAAAAATALQPALDHYIKTLPTWVSTVQRTFENPQVLTFLQEWARLAASRSDSAATEPDGITLAALSALADADEVQEAELDAFEAELSEIDVLDQILDEAALSLATEHPFLTKAQARRVVVVLAYVGWVATLVGLGVAGSPMLTFAALVLSAGGVDAPRVSRMAEKGVEMLPDRFFSAEVEHPGQDSEDNPADEADGEHDE